MKKTLSSLRMKFNHLFQNRNRISHKREADCQLKESMVEVVMRSPDLQRELMDQFVEKPESMSYLLKQLDENEGFRSRVIGRLVDLEFLQKKFYSLLRNDPEQMRRLILVVEKEPELYNSLATFVTRKWIQADDANLKKFAQAIQSDPDLHRDLFYTLGNQSEFHDEYLHSLWTSDASLLGFFKMLTENDDLREKFIQQVMQQEKYRSIFRTMRDREVMNQLSYSLPTVTLSFPRSGSNFFQSVLQGSSGFTCLSLYHSNYPNYQVFNLKSHALTPDRLRREFADMVPYDLDFPKKIILIQRDPRDVMISLYEFACANHDQHFSQEEFLNMNYYFAANQPGKRGVKNIYYLPGPESCTVLEAFRLFTASYFKGEGNDAVHLMRYEQMVKNPDQAFTDAFRFLDLDCDLNPAFIHFKVSQYSEGVRKRGIAGGWRDPKTQDRYAVLMDLVSTGLAEEIKSLGYPLI